MDVWQEMRDALRRREEADLLRRPAVVESACGPKVTLGGREVVCLCSNDYLSLAADARVCAAAVEAVRRWGVGAGASRLISGTSAVHVELERRLAEFKCVPAAVVTSTGWMANHVAVSALAGRGDLVLCDKLNHASLIDAARSSGAVLRTYPHRDTRRLARLLVRLRGRFRRCLIATDSLFSMDGDLAPLKRLAALKRAHGAQLLIDEAHATGVVGANGRGVAERLDVEGEVDVVVGTLSKAIGSLGGFVAGPTELIDTITNAGRAFIYTTAPPPAVCAAALAALELIRSEPHRRRRLLAAADELRAALRARGLDTGESAAQIIPIVLGEAGRALRVSERLLAAGFFVPAVRPPTVPRGTSRLRVSLCAGHRRADLLRFVDALVESL